MIRLFTSDNYFLSLKNFISNNINPKLNIFSHIFIVRPFAKIFLKFLINYHTSRNSSSRTFSHSFIPEYNSYLSNGDISGRRSSYLLGSSPPA